VKRIFAWGFAPRLAGTTAQSGALECAPLVSQLPRPLTTSVPSWVLVMTIVVFAIAGSAIAEPQTDTESAPDATMDEIVVRGQQPAPPDLFIVSPERATLIQSDTTKLLELVPGGDVIDNGPLSGQVQYRGMFGSRVDVRVNDMYINPGGPNWMDPPLHYAPRPIVENLEVDRGITSVRVGAETIGGSARAKLKRSDFGSSSEFRFGADLEAGGRSVNESFSGGGIVSASNNRHRFHVLGSAEIGDDMRAGHGTIRPSEHERYSYGGGYGIRLGEHDLGVDYRHSDTEPTGNPALPMDIRYLNTELLGGDYSGRWSEVDFAAKIYYSDVDHAMDNVSQRTPPGPSRRNDTESDGLGWKFEASYAVGPGTLAVGTDGHRATHDARITDPTNPAFFVDAFRDVRRRRYGMFAEWKGEPVDQWEAELGFRYTRVSAKAGRVDALPAQAPGAPQVLRNRFNAASRNQSDDLFDVVLKLGREIVPGLQFELGAGRKTRAPSYLERYAWIPTQASSGLADFNNYVGDIKLDHEISYEVEGGFEWRTQWVYLAPRAFYRQVDDYIQGSPVEVTPENLPVIMVSTANGDPTPLEFTNLKAEFYGFDVAYGVDLPFDLELGGILSWVRGKRRDINDDLYRVTPLRGRSTLSYRRESWSVSIEGVYAARQNHVSKTNSETKTGGYGIANCFGRWEVSKGIALELGLENIFDESYDDHLAGFNRVANSAAKVGDRLPGPGRSVFGRITGRY
jgi:iron complex outermembrane receptor protein